MNAPVSMQDLQRAQQQGSASTALINQPSQLPTHETASTATAAKMKAIVQARYEVAFFRPRDMDSVREKMLKECRRPSFAEVARYNKPIGKGVVGPSIRFAEMAVRCMSNIVVETTTVYDDREKRIVNVSVTDLEGNVPYAQDVTITKAVERRKVKDGDVVLRQRSNSYGDTVYLLEATDDEILNQQNALISKAIRTLGLRLIPGDIVDECMDLVVETQQKKDATDPDASKRKLFDSFAAVGVSVEEIKKYLGHAGETINPKELAGLRGIFSAIREGETTWREVMDGKDESPKDKPKAKADPPKQSEKPAEKVADKKPDQEPPGKEASRQESKQSSAAPPSDLYVSYKDQINECGSTEDMVLIKKDLELKMRDEKYADEREILLDHLARRMVELNKKESAARPARPQRSIE